MPNIVINHVGSNTEIQSDSTPISYVTSAATVTDIDDTHISVTVGGVPIITMDINDITSIDGAAPYGNAEQVVSQITGQSAPAGTPTLSQVLTAGASAGAKITNLTDPTADQDAATKKYVDDNAGGLGYLVYTALLTQSSTDPIVATVLQNTMGTVTVSAFSTAEYILLETTIDYDPAKVFIGGFTTAEGNGAVYVPIISGAVLVGYYSVNAYAEAGKLAFQVAFYTDAFAAASMSSLLTTNRFSMPEVRVYP